MANRNKDKAIVLRGILGPASGTIGGITFFKSGSTSRKTSLSDFPAVKYNFRLFFRRFPGAKIRYLDKLAYSCQQIWNRIVIYFPDAVFVSCHKIT